MTVRYLAPGMYRQDEKLVIVTDELAEAAGQDPDWTWANVDRLMQAKMAEYGKRAYVKVRTRPPWVGVG